MIILSKASQAEKTNIVWHHLYEEAKKVMQRDLFMKQKQTPDLKNKPMVTGGRDIMGVWDGHKATLLY